MSLTVIKIEPKFARMLLALVAFATLVAAWFFIKWNFANAVASRIDTGQPEAASVAEWLVGLAPSDPQTHFASARVFEKTFNPGDLTKSLIEYEAATALSPNHYVMWLSLGRARSLNGDDESAAVAYALALRLAPNYAAVQWAYGNALIRQGDTEQGFAMIARAASANPDYARTTALTALEMFAGDLNRVRQVLGDSDATNASLAAVLAKQGRFDEAFDAWSKLAEKPTKHAKLGAALIEQMTTAKKFQFAAHISTDIQTGEGERPMTGQISNGGFEGGVKLRNAGLFEWQIAGGAQPQIGLAESGSHGGRYGLLAIFNSFETAAFRSISQTVPVMPGTVYEFEVFYKSDLKTQATLKWEIADAGSSASLATTAAMTPATDWTSLKVKFTAPAACDGVIIRLAREGCSGPSCPANGKMSFDDFSLRRL